MFWQVLFCMSLTVGGVASFYCAVDKGKTADAICHILIRLGLIGIVYMGGFFG